MKAKYFILKDEWEDGGFVYNGRVYAKGKDDSAAMAILNSLFEPMKIQPIEISAEVQQLRPFIQPAKGFGMDEVMTLIQKVYNAKP